MNAQEKAPAGGSRRWLGWALTATAVIALSGCLTPFRSPADVRHVSLAAEDSANVIVNKIWLERPESGRLVVTGYVVRTLEADDTTGTHLVVSLYDADGKVLRSEVVNFEPRQIPRRSRPPGEVARYSLPLEPLPTGLAKITVKAVDKAAP